MKITSGNLADIIGALPVGKYAGYYSSGATGTPSSYGTFEAIIMNDSTATITAIDTSNGANYIRIKTSNTWKGWERDVTNADFARESTDLNTAFNGIGAISMYNWSNTTLHTPHKEGATVYGNGFAIGFDIGSFKVQVAFAVGENRIFIRSLRDGGAFSAWTVK